MRTVKKVVACVIRGHAESRQILSFIHPPPLSDFQIPKGTLEEGEVAAKAVLRELEEESGITDALVDRHLGSFWIECPGGPDGNMEMEKQLWEVFLIMTLQPLPNHWVHKVTGHGVDSGMSYSYFWHDLSRPSERYHQKFRTLFNFLHEKMPL
ncbi:MAG: NUDIX domain-containing protein [Saprospiraceae bacterium]|nr:NUDIX domain-containing protein [Saprospiraceae bacterium]